jgi:hypothetical protein
LKAAGAAALKSLSQMTFHFLYQRRRPLPRVPAQIEEYIGRQPLFAQGGVLRNGA